MWLYRGQIEKYAELIDEYCAEIRSAAGAIDDKDTKNTLANVTSFEDFAVAHAAITAFIGRCKEKAKKAVDAVKQRERKRVRESLAGEISQLEEQLIVIDEALWLTEKFGAGTYTDVPGLCKIATQKDIEVKNWSLTPGAYVGVPPQEGDGVDFHERMSEIYIELKQLQTESNEFMNTISKNFEELGL